MIRKQREVRKKYSKVNLVQPILEVLEENMNSRDE